MKKQDSANLETTGCRVMETSHGAFLIKPLQAFMSEKGGRHCLWSRLSKHGDMVTNFSFRDKDECNLHDGYMSALDFKQSLLCTDLIQIKWVLIHFRWAWPFCHKHFVSNEWQRWGLFRSTVQVKRTITTKKDKSVSTFSCLSCLNCFYNLFSIDLSALAPLCFYSATVCSFSC